MEALASGVRAGNRLALAKALTLIESTKPAHQTAAADLLQLLHGRGAAPPTAPPRVDAFRIGVSGPPGAGKSSLIETLGCALVDAGERVAVLAVDPSSDASGGAILGDKTRMSRLSSLDAAFVRPSPTRGALGGVARTTAEALAVCGAAGYSRLLVETVGVGQSEIAVADLVDCMLLVLPPVGGDELQAIKRGITEVADVVAVNKADGAMKTAAAMAAASFRATIHLHPIRKQSWTPVVLPVSAHSGEGVVALLEALNEYWRAMQASGELREVSYESVEELKGKDE
jgi:LAO/AO transport system kinase